MEREFNFPIAVEADKPVELKSVLIPLTSEEEATALTFALTFAKSKGLEDPGEKDPLYDLGYMAQVVALAARDPDVGTPGGRPPTFASAEEVMGALTRETLTYAYVAFQAWADECSPTRRRLSADQLMAAVREMAKEGDDGDRFFAECGPATQKALLRFMASLLVTLLEHKSPSTSSTETGTATPTLPESPPSPTSNT